jgi:integrase
MRRPTQRTARKVRDEDKGWSYSDGAYGARIRVYERDGRPHVYAQVARGGVAGKYDRFPLPGMDRTTATAWAKEQAARLMRGESVHRPGTRPVMGEAPTWANLFASYLAMQTPQKSETEQEADARRAELWTRVLGASTHPAALNAEVWLAFQRDRASGTLTARGERMAAKDRAPVAMRTVQMDCLWLRQVCNWAMDHWVRRDTGEYVLHRNPVRPLKMPGDGAHPMPHVDADRFQALRAVSDRVMMEERQGKAVRQRSYLSEILDLLWLTGHRVSAVLALRYSDVLKPDDEFPTGALRWRGEQDKSKHEHRTPLTAGLSEVIDRIRRERPGVGDVYLFPKPTNRDKPVDRWRVRHWLERAEELAALPKQGGTMFHAFRRGFATARKHHPIADIAAAGGWKRKETVLRHYTNADAEGMRRVLEEPAPARERRA